MLTIKMHCDQCEKSDHIDMEFDQVSEMSVRGLHRRLTDSESDWIVNDADGDIEVFCSEQCESDFNNLTPTK